ncbi:vascular endothelial growth factor C-like [Conger conger]|uniref:vascular endothelial growth factor C-like n=1 Tax=Conger conger TaxID=82655 RepID=UPI002A5A5193|nr:vascular endothelial growth factor C-like [Conger conger]
MRTLPVTVWVLWVWNLSHGSARGRESQERTANARGAGQRGLGAASSVEDVLELLYPQDARVQHCLRRKAQAPATPPRPGELTWENPREAALRWDDGAIQVIMAEMERTSCRPREVCVEVSREYPEGTRHVYVPRCVSLHRCGGCCNHEALHCYNTSYRTVNKTLLELSPSKMERSVAMVTFVNHTSCDCRPKRPLHAVIRREADAHRHVCPSPGVPCSPGLVWDPAVCLCVHRNSSSFSDPELDPLFAPLLALCGPFRVLDGERCECVCQNGLRHSSCGQGRRLDNASCQCVCEGGPGLCPPGQSWDPERCACVCPPGCPPGLAPQPGTCMCRCRESPHTCLLQGRRFDPHTCSCYRLPCRTPSRKCASGFYFSHFVCSCLPEHMRTDKLH